MNRRRKLVVALGAGVLTAPVGVFAQKQSPRVFRIGILTDTPSPMLDAFLQGLRDHGYIEGKNTLIERRFLGGDIGKAQSLARELVAFKADVIYARASTHVEAVRQLTADIPIVFSMHNDPIGTGHVASFARPGGNITGVTVMAPELNAKRLEILLELVPRATHVAVLSNPTTPSHRPALKELELLSDKLGLRLHFLEASVFEQIALAFKSAVNAGDRALLLLTSPLSLSEHKRIAALALRSQLPVSFGDGASVEAGGLVSYGPDLNELNRHAADYVDKILKGAKPSELPVEQPTKFELILNLKTAKALGIKIPQSIRVRADKLIE